MLPWAQTIVKSSSSWKRVFIFVLPVFLFAAMFAIPVSAQDTLGTQDVGNAIALGGGDIRVVIMKIIRALLGLLGIVALGINVYAGFIIMTSQGQEEKITTGKTMLRNGVIGLAIILMSFAIVQFVITALGSATGLSGFLGGGRGPAAMQTFAGSGALGDTITDHYPFRNQADVPRNTQIVITFAQPVDMGSMIVNTNNTCWGADGQPTNNCQQNADGEVENPYFGDCFNPNGGRIDPAQHCDQLNTEAIRIFKVRDLEADGDLPLVNAAAMTVYEDGDERNAFTLVIKPLEALGDAIDDITYTVDVMGEDGDARGVLWKTGEGVFDGDRDGHYDWSFITDTTFDFVPPHITRTTPSDGGSIFRNTIVQMTFSEPVNPLAVQGQFGAQSPFHNILFHDERASGEWKITNGYRTVEFIPDIPCGQNSCGQSRYCLFVSCGENDQDCTEQYDTLVRTAELTNPETFEAAFGTGVTDMASNALDGRSDPAVAISHDGESQDKPPMAVDRKDITDAQKAADNFYFTFKVKNQLDLRVPYISDMRPVIDQGNVAADEPVILDFSMGMRYGTLKNISLIEDTGRPDQGDALPDGIEDVRPIWHSVRTVQIDDVNGDGQVIGDHTRSNVLHREFGPNNFDFYYYTAVSSSVQGVNQNCLYPGRGPAYEEAEVVRAADRFIAPTCDIVFDDNGVPDIGEHCSPVQVDAALDTACMRGNVPNDVRKTDNIASCIDALEAESIRVFINNPAPPAEEEPAP
jgi:hypothetical protein